MHLARPPARRRSRRRATSQVTRSTLDLGDVDRPAVRSVRVAACTSRRPTARRAAARYGRRRASVAERVDVGPARRRGSPAVPIETGRVERGRRAPRAAVLDQLADDHARARRDRRAAVGHGRRVGLDDVDRVADRSRARRRRSARRSCWCPDRSRCSTRAPARARRRSPRRPRPTRDDPRPSR